MPFSTALEGVRFDRLTVRVGWVLLPLRLFLGVTFVFAGLQKLADPNYLDDHAPTGVRQQLLTVSRNSPIGGMLSSFAHHSTVIGLLIAFAELAIGLGAVLGLWTRIAALGGALISLGFLLSVSWHTHPYYLGSDIVFFFAWTPLIVAGAAGVLSLDARFAAHVRQARRIAPFGRVDIDFAVVRRMCGAYAKGRCDRLNGAPCDPTPCPVLAETPRLRPEIASDLDRRQFLETARAAAGVAAGAAVAAGGVAGLGRLLHDQSPRRGTSALRLKPDGTRPSNSADTTTTGAAPLASSTTTPVPPPSGTAIGPAASVPVGTAASFTDPHSGDPAYVVHPIADVFHCFSGVCTHAGCTVDYSNGRFVCPCHGAEFDATTGAVLRGPANQPLPPINITLGGDGQLYVTD